MEAMLRDEGWAEMSDKGFGNHIGPFLMRRREGLLQFGLRVGPQHENVLGRVHGGLLATLADSALGWTIMDSLGNTSPSVTIQLDLQFLGGVKSGDFVCASAQIVRRTRHFVFAEGDLEVDGRKVLRANGIWKILANSADRS